MYTICETWDARAITSFRQSIYVAELGYESETSEATPYLNQIGRHWALYFDGIMIGYVLIVGHKVHRLMLRKEHRNTRATLVMLKLIEAECWPYAIAQIKPAFADLLRRKGYKVRVLMPGWVAITPANKSICHPRLEQIAP